MSWPLALALAFVVAVASSCASAPPARRDVVIGLAAEPLAVMGDDPGARVIRAAVTESLVRRDREGRFVPRLAIDVPTLANGGLRIDEGDAAPAGRLVATFALRNGARWQDGTPITADDVRFAFEDDRAAPLGSERRWMADRVDRVDVLDGRHVRFTYRMGERWPLYPLAARVLPAHLLAGASAGARAAYDRVPMHAGPFRVSAWVPGVGMTLSAFPQYVTGAPHLGRIQVRFFRDEGAVVDALRRGEIDVAPSPAVEADLTRTLDHFAVPGSTLVAQYTPAMSVAMLRLGSHGPLADPLVRQALLLALDRRALVGTLFAGRALVPRSYLVPPLDVASASLEAPRHDPAAATALLARAGFVRGGLGVLERGGERMAVTLQIAGGSHARILAGRSLVADLAAVGIAVNGVERSADAVAAAVASGDFDLALVSEPADDAERASAAYLGTGPWFDVLQRAAAAAEGPDRASLYAELQAVWAGALPGIPIYQELLVDVVPTGLQGVQPTPNGEPITWNAAEWRFSAEVN